MVLSFMLTEVVFQISNTFSVDFPRKNDDVFSKRFVQAGVLDSLLKR